MNNFWREWTTGDVVARDELQLELKSDIAIHSSTTDTVFKQEFYIFMPSSLLSNAEGYTKEQFYSDETNLIRFKTPAFTFQEIIQSKKSPLNRIPQLYEMPKVYQNNPHFVLDEIRLFGNIFRSALRNAIHDLFFALNRHEAPSQTLLNQINQLYSEVQESRHLYRNLQKLLIGLQSDLKLTNAFKFVDEFLSYTIQDYMTILLKNMRDLQLPELKELDDRICGLILEEKDHLLKTTPPIKEEFLLHRISLLNKFVLESLMLKTNRVAVHEKHKPLIGMIAAAVAVTTYLLLIAWKSPSLAIGSTPFIFLAIILYVLKDRIKEGLKNYYHKQAFKWFPDYRTDIIDHDNHIIGRLTESFSYVSRENAPINKDKEWSDLDDSEIPGVVMRYKRKVTLFPNTQPAKARRSELNTFFRLNLHHLLQKASDPLQLHLDLNPGTLEIQSKLLPKVYNIYILVQQYYEQENQEVEAEVKKFRVVVNKKGIKRVLSK